MPADLQGFSIERIRRVRIWKIMSHDQSCPRWGRNIGGGGWQGWGRGTRLLASSLAWFDIHAISFSQAPFSSQGTHQFCGIFFYWFEVRVRRPGMWPKFDSTFSLILSKWIMCKLVALSQSKHQHLRPCKRTDFLTRLWEINWYETSLHPLVKLWRTGGQGHHGPVGGPFANHPTVTRWHTLYIQCNVYV